MRNPYVINEKTFLVFNAFRMYGFLVHFFSIIFTRLISIEVDFSPNGGYTLQQKNLGSGTVDTKSWKYAIDVLYPIDVLLLFLLTEARNFRT